MDGEPWVEHVCAVLQGGGATEHDETQLAVLEAGAKVDTEYVAFGLEESLHGETYLDKSSLCGVHNGAPNLFLVYIAVLIGAFTARWTN